MNCFMHALVVLSLPFAAGVNPVTKACSGTDVCSDTLGDETVQLQVSHVKSALKEGPDITVYDEAENHDEDEGTHEAVYPFDLMKCHTEPPLKTEHMNTTMYDTIIEDFRVVFSKLPEKCEGMDCVVADVCGCILRMAGHDFMDYKDGVGGSDACTDMNEPDNAGLADCLVEGTEGATIKEVYEKHCEFVSLADFVVIAAEAAMTYTRQIYLNVTSQDRGTVDFKTQFKYGRTTGKTCTENQILPDPAKSCRDVERVFVDNMGLDWRLSAALMGVHTLGRAQLKNSGFQGWWSDAKNSRRFNNNYFVSLYLKGWIPEQVESGKWQWAFSDENRDDALNGKQMMLDSDFCLAWSNMPDTHGYEEILASDPVKTCAWTIPNLTFEVGESEGEGIYPLFEAIDKYNDGKFCGIKIDEAMRDLPGGAGLFDRIVQWKSDGWFEQKHQKRALSVFMELRAACCNGCKSFTGKLGGKCEEFSEASGFPVLVNDTGFVTHPTGMAKQYVIEFANDERVWVGAFLEAWAIATTNGFDDLTPLIEAAPPPTPPPAACKDWCHYYELSKESDKCSSQVCGACTECGDTSVSD